MKYHALLCMYNDLKRAEFVIDNFKKNNPDIPLTIYNGGEKLQTDKIVEMTKKNEIHEILQGPNLWHNKTRHPPGSFDFRWFELLFEISIGNKSDCLIFLETDVKTTKKIEIEPEYDISGPVVSCGYMESLVMYDYWSNYIEGKPFTEDKFTTWNHKLHTGMGGTALTKNFFEKTEKNLPLVKECYELIPFNCYQDVLISCLARYSGCTMGDWKESTDTRGTFRLKNDKWISEPCDEKCALIHNYKV